MVLSRNFCLALGITAVLAGSLPAAYAQSGYYRHAPDSWDPVESFFGDNYRAGDLNPSRPSPWGSPPDNAFDPTRPYGGQAAITAPPGTAAFDEQYTNRRYLCREKPERC